jgi:thiamine pyrophosphate-dependent acetolactate synthase large subunit-like protein
MQIDSPSTAPAAERTIPKTGAQIIVDALRAHGVETIFGYIGASVLPLFDRLYDSPIRFVIPCHEQGGCHMADAYARASGRVGVVVATSGPGACNLVTRLATAMMDFPKNGHARQISEAAEAINRSERPVLLAVGAVGITVRAKDQVGPALARMLREDKPCVVDFHVEAEENVWPMVPAGKSLEEMQGLEVLQNAM